VASNAGYNAEPSLMTTSGRKPQVARLRKKRLMCFSSLVVTKANPTGMSANGSVASSKVWEPR
jgi:hypothetical protein